MFNSKFGVGVLKHPGYNVGGGIGEAALLGAAFGGAKSLATGEDILEGALMGGLTGGAMSGVTGAIMGGAGSTAANTVASTADDAAKLALEQAKLSSANMLTPTMPEIGMANSFNTLTGAPIAPIADQGIASVSNQMVGQNAISGGLQGGIPDALQTARTAEFANTGRALSDHSATNIFGDRGFDVRDYTNPDTMLAKGADWWEKQGLGGQAMYSGLGGLAYGAMNPNTPEMPKLEEQKSKLAGYNREGFSPYSAEQPDPYYAAQYRDYRTAAQGGVMNSYAEGGIAALANGGMGNNLNFPQGRLDSTQYATPTQLPASASVINADYEQATDPYSGSPIKMAEGGTADKYTPSYNTPTASTTQMPNFSLGNAFDLLQAANPGIASSYLYGNGISAAPGLNAMVSQGYNRVTGQPITPTALQQQYASPALNPQSFSAYTSQKPLINQTPTRPYIVPQAAPAAPTTPTTGYSPFTSQFLDMANHFSRKSFEPDSNYGNQYAGYSFNGNAFVSPNGPTVNPGDPNFDAMANSMNMMNMAAKGGLMHSYAQGGIAGYSLGGYAAGGNPRLLQGPGDGMSDNIPATIGGKQPARLADGEFVVPADVVSHLGNGSTDAGAKHLYDMMNKVRKARTGKVAQGKQIKPEKFLPV